MILNVSGRTDILAFYTPWFMNRIREGYFDVRNPFSPKAVSRIYMDRLDAFLFCTKNPIPLLPFLDEIDKPILMDVTITAYHKDIEPYVPDKEKVIEAVKVLSEKLGKDKVVVRYDPIFLNERYTVKYHLKAFERLCMLLEGYVEEICLSFLDEYKNVLKNKEILQYRTPGEEEYKRLAEGFLESAKKRKIHLYTCHEGGVLEPYGIEEGHCLSPKRAYELTGLVFGPWKARNCGCAQMVDVGSYNTCPHLCRYCYANFNEKMVYENRKNHDPSSSLLIGHIQSDDEIRIRVK